MPVLRWPIYMYRGREHETSTYAVAPWASSGMTGQHELSMYKVSESYVGSYQLELHVQCSGTVHAVMYVWRPTYLQR